MKRLFAAFYILLALSNLGATTTKQARLISNGYEDVLVAIHDSVPEDTVLVEKIKDMMTEASSALFSATKGRAFFRTVKILVPETWTQGHYSSSGDETYDTTDIRIAPANPHAGDTPYARRKPYGGCGDQMQYIHLTPTYVKSDGIPQSFGPIGKTVVHEWAHYRWGVFDEYPTGYTTAERHTNSFYLNQTGHVEATRCSLGIQGRYYDWFTKQACETDPGSRLPRYGCFFDDYNHPQKQEINVSLMYKQFISGTTTFCHDNASDPMNLHNKEAPNNQNKYCNFRSTWDVISNTLDFKFDNPPNPAIQDTKPQFSVIQAQIMSIVLVVDTSGSMDGSKLESLRQSAAHFLSTCVTYGTYVGLVSFASDATILHNLVLVNNEATKQDLIDRLPTVASGSTGIGSGILKGIQVLEQGGRGSEGGVLAVLTDGEENEMPYVETISSQAIQKKVIVHGIFFGLVNSTSARSLTDLSIDSSGTWFYNSDDPNSKAELNNIFCTIAEPQNGDISNSSVTVASATLTVYANTPATKNVSIDGSVGNRTTFSFAWTTNEPTIELQPPNSSCYYSNRVTSGSMICGNIHSTSNELKTVRFTIPGTAEIGLWQYTITMASSDVITVAVTSASAVEGEYPVTVKPDVVQVNILGVETVILIAQVFQNTLPVTGANVTAKVTRPVGEQIEVQLMDNGAGADNEPNDGVYSRYFTSFTVQGRYSVEVTVFKDGSEVSKNNLTKSGTNYRSPQTFNPFESLPNEFTGANITGILERVASSPGFAYNGQVTTTDIFPPNKITDLSVVQRDLDDASSGVTVTFTAPGDDFDSGSASYYDVRYTEESFSRLLSNFEGQIQLNVSNGNPSTTPKEALSRENLVISLPIEVESASSVRLAFAVRAYDDSNNPSEISNVALMTFFIEPPPRAATQTTPSSSISNYIVSYWLIAAALLKSMLLD